MRTKGTGAKRRSRVTVKGTFKKKAVALAMVLTLGGTMASTVPMFADTTNFNVTVNKNNSNKDPISKRTKKAGGGKFENKFYATATGFSVNGSITAQSIELVQKKIKSKKLTLSSASVGKVRSASYKTTAKANKYYYMKADYVQSSLGAGAITVVGRYTP